MKESSLHKSLFGQNRKTLFVLFSGILMAAALELIFILMVRYLIKAGFENENQQLKTGTFFMVTMIPLGLVSIRATVQWKVIKLLIGYVENWYQSQRRFWIKTLSETGYPIARPAEGAQFKNVMVENLAAIRAGGLAVFQSLGALMQMILFVPVLFFFPLKLSLIVILLMVPVILVSRIRIMVLRRYSSKWIHTLREQNQSTIRLSQRIKYFSGNNILGNILQSYRSHSETRDRDHSKWEFTQSVFPTIMELIYFGMLCVVFGAIMGGGIKISAQPWDWIPFTVLVVLMYKPIREWSRYYPQIIMGQEAWNSTREKMNTWLKFAPRPVPLISPDSQLKIKNLYFGYSESPVFENLSVDVDPREITLIFGPNGSGKSTLLNLICRTEFPASGQIYYPEALLYAGNISVTYLPQPVKSDDNIIEVMKKYRHEYPEKWKGLNNILNLNKILDLPGTKQASGGNPENILSGGEFQRLCLARAFTSESPLLLLDEPTTWLPGVERMQIMEYLFHFWRNSPGSIPDRGVIVTSHESELQNICDRQIKLVPMVEISGE